MKYLLPIASFMLVTLCAHAQRGHVEDALQKKYTEQYGQPGANKFNDYMNNTFGGKTEDSYTFPLYLNMHFVEYKNGKKKDESDIKYYVDASSGNFAFIGVDNGKKNSGEDMTMIYDSKNTSMIMVNDAEKTAIAINFGMLMNSGMVQRKAQKKYEDEMQDISCKKTGKSKAIQGYSCIQYQCVDKDEDSKADVWVTDGIPVDVKKASNFGLWNMYFLNSSGIGGMMMEGKFYEDGQLSSSLEITELNKKADHTVNMSDYQMTGIGGGR